MTHDERTERLMPQNVEAERQVLGSMLIDPSVIRDVAAIMQPEDCYRDAHVLICRAIYDLYREHHLIDLNALYDLFIQRGQLDAIQGMSYVTSLANAIETPRNATFNAERVQATAVQRRVIAFCGALAADAYEEADPQELINTARAKVETLAIKTMGVQGHTLAEAIDSYLARVDDAVSGPYDPGIETGFLMLDQHLTGIKRGELIYLAGRPGSGKSAVASAIALYNARRGKHVEWVTLEMPRELQVQRLIAATGGIDGRILRADFRRRDGSVDEYLYQFAREIGMQLRAEIGHTIHIEDQPVTLRDLTARMSRAVLDKGRDLIVLDYLGLIEGDDPRQNDYQRISAISRTLKGMALELNVPVICLVQLNREVEKRADKRPMMADLRDSGGLEQDADVILGIYRGAYYDQSRAATDSMFAQLGELIVLKARGGVANVALPFQWEGEYTRPSNWPDEWSDYWHNYNHQRNAGNTGGNGNGE